MTSLDPAHRVRLLKRLMGDDPTEKECQEMWEDRPRLERLLALEEGVEWRGPEHNGLQAYDYELWRAKVRTELGSLTGVLDGLAICQQHNLILPDWLHETTGLYLAYLSLPESANGYKDIRSRFRAERSKLKMQKRAQIVHKLYMKHVWPKERADQHRSVLRVRETFKSFDSIAEDMSERPGPPEVEVAIQKGLIQSDFEVSSIAQAAELAHLALRGTWAQASVETIRQDYNSARVQLRVALGRDELSKREEEFVYWDVAFVRPETLDKLGMYQAG